MVPRSSGASPIHYREYVLGQGFIKSVSFYHFQFLFLATYQNHFYFILGSYIHLRF